jgi:hypothetical protein
VEGWLEHASLNKLQRRKHMEKKVQEDRGRDGESEMRLEQANA